MDNVKYAKYLKKEMKPFDNATMVEWTEVKIHTFGTIP